MLSSTTGTPRFRSWSWRLITLLQEVHHQHPVTWQGSSRLLNSEPRSWTLAVVVTLLWVGRYQLRTQGLPVGLVTSGSVLRASLWRSNLWPTSKNHLALAGRSGALSLGARTLSSPRIERMSSLTASTR